MCGIVGITNHPEAANLAYLCLYALQHRGQESVGIVTSDGKKFFQHKAMGLVDENISANTLSKLHGKNAIGHVRYSTAGSSILGNAQPFIANTLKGSLAIVHNGNLTNAITRRQEMEHNGSIFQSTMDSEVIMHEIAGQKGDGLVDRLLKALQNVEGAYSLLLMDNEMLVAARDPKGFRPLSIGKLDNSYVIVSETCALDLINAKFLREVKPGEIVAIKGGELQSWQIFPGNDKDKKAHCIFEYVYFARPDSSVFGRDVYPIRKGFGVQLAREHPVDADVVIAVPDSGVPAAIGYAQEAKIPFELGLIRNHYVGRTFIEPQSEIRHFGVKIKLNPVHEVLNNKRVVVVDDSIVRGTTSKKIVEMLRKSGAKEVHMRISAPPTVWPCFYGIDTPTRKELVAANKSVEDIRKFIGADSLGYLSHEGLYWFEKQSPKEWFCDACFTGNYPVNLTDYPKIMKEAKCES
ncbi:MAG: amidophosphoribosyltransferase [Pseudomonadota bacterium]